MAADSWRAFKENSLHFKNRVFGGCWGAEKTLKVGHIATDCKETDVLEKKIPSPLFQEKTHVYACLFSNVQLIKRDPACIGIPEGLKTHQSSASYQVHLLLAFSFLLAYQTLTKVKQNQAEDTCSHIASSNC